MEYSFENGHEYLREWEMNPGEVERSHNRMNRETSKIRNEAREHGALSLLQEAGMKPGGLVGAVSHQWIEISHNRKESELGMKLKIRMKPK